MSDFIFISLRDVMEILKISKTTAIRLIRKGELRAMRDLLQNRFLVSEESVKEFMKNRFREEA